MMNPRDRLCRFLWAALVWAWHEKTSHLCGDQALGQLLICALNFICQPDRVLNAGVIYSYQTIVLQGQLTNNILT